MKAAQRFIDGIKDAWDSREPWELTAANGLSETDDDTLQAFCRDSGEPYPQCYAEVMEFVRSKVATH